MAAVRTQRATAVVFAITIHAVAVSVCALPQWPRFSWDTVPVFYHSCNFSGDYSGKALKLIARYPMVTIEKGQGVLQPSPPFAETKITRTLKRVKALNPNVSAIFYYNAVLDWPYYELHHKFLQHPDWWLKTSPTNSSPCRMNGAGGFPGDKNMLVFDFAQAAVRRFWASECINMTKLGYIDGCFSDRAFVPTSGPGWPHYCFGGADPAGFIAGHTQVHQELQEELTKGDANGVLIANAAYTMKGVGATQIEQFEANDESIRLLQTCVRHGKLTQAHAGAVVDGGDNHCQRNPINSLAAFLIGAGKYSYYACSKAWNIKGADMDQVSSAWHWSYDMPLGEPVADGVQDPHTRVWRRQFKHVVHGLTNVSFVDGKGNIDWSTPAPPTPSPPPPPPPPPSGYTVSGAGTGQCNGYYLRQNNRVVDGAPVFIQQHSQGIALQLYRFKGKWNLGIDGNFSLYASRCQSELPPNHTKWARTCTIYNYSCHSGRRAELPAPSLSGDLSTECTLVPTPAPAPSRGPCPSGQFGPHGHNPDPPDDPNFPDFSCIAKNCSCNACRALWPQTGVCPDLHSVQPDLVRPPMINGTPAAGRRVRQTAPGYAHTEVYHALYLPADWKRPANQTGNRYPIIVEYMANGPWHENNMPPYPPDVSSGLPEDSNLGFGISAGTRYIWISMPFLTSDLGAKTRISTSWWGCPDATPIHDCGIQYNATPTIDYTIQTIAFVVEQYGGDADRVMVTGWSRGAIACGAIGLANNQIAKLWRAFMPYAHMDGDAGWNNFAKDGTDPGDFEAKTAVRERYARLAGRPVLATAECNVATEIGLAWLSENNLTRTTAGVGLNYTFMSTGYSNHNDAWVLRPGRARNEMRAWVDSVMLKTDDDRQRLSSRPPNLVFFLTDDQDQMLGGSFPTTAAGNATPMPKTKLLLADRGATARSFLVHTPICCPSRAETFTGRFLHNVQAPFAPKDKHPQCVDSYVGSTSHNTSCCMHVDEGLVNNHTFAVELARAGYTVGAFGKTLNVVPLEPYRGVDAWLVNGGGVYYSVPSENLSFAVHNIDGVPDGMISFDERATAKLDLMGSSYSTSVIGNYSVAWIKKVAGKHPFMAYIGTLAPHDPFVPAKWYASTWNNDWPTTAPRTPSWNMTKKQLSRHHPTVANQSPLTQKVAGCIDAAFRLRWQTLMSVDDLISAAVEAVEAAGVANNTYFLYSSDHGYQLGQLNLPEDKRNVYEFDTKVHFLMTGPGIKAGSFWSEMTSNSDIAPTLLSIAGVDTPPSMDGRSFLHLVVDEQSTQQLPLTVRTHLKQHRAQPWRSAHFIQHNSVGAGNYPSDICPRFKVGCPFCVSRSHASDRHYVDKDDNNYIAIRVMANTTGSGSKWEAEFLPIYRAATTISQNFLYAEFQWNNIEQFKCVDQFNGQHQCGYEAPVPLSRHLGSNNQDGGWHDGWQNDTMSSPGNINFTTPFFFELFDMDADPFQMHNIYADVHASEPTLVAAMHEHVQRLHRCTGLTCP